MRGGAGKRWCCPDGPIAPGVTGIIPIRIRRRPTLFALSPDGALHYGGVHGWDQPGATTPPAAKDQVWFEIRALKCKDDPMRIDPSDYYRGGNPTIRNDGGNPPAALVDPLFQRIDPSEASNPIKLGMDKTRFYGDFNGGWGWRRAIAS